MSIERIAKLSRLADRTIDQLTAQPVPDDPVTAEAMSTAVTALTDLRRRAADPVTIGVVGGYSVGKSLLIGTLLGRPDLLPVESRPTTGNVTEIRLTAGPAGSRTSITAASVTVMTTSDLSSCVDYILSELVRELHETAPGRDTSALTGYHPVTDGWNRLEQWCRKELWAGPEDPKLRGIAAELLAIRDAQAQGSAYLGVTLPVADPDQLRRALDLGAARSLPDRVWSPPATPALQPGAAVDETVLSVLFPLLRRITYRVAVPPETWTLDQTEAAGGLALLDFPGLGGVRSGKRDEYLSQQELKGTHTILVVVSMREPDSRIVQDFYGMMQRHGKDVADAILVVGNKFDAFPPPEFPGGAALRLEQVRSASQHFAGFYYNAREMVPAGRDDRMLPYSSYLAIDHYDMPLPGTEHEHLLITEALPSCRRYAERWQAIAKRLSTSQVSSALVSALAEFSQDGGRTALHRMIERHVRDHGIRLRLVDLETHRNQVRVALRALRTALGPRCGPAARQRDDRLVELFQTIDAAQRQLANAAPEFADPWQVQVDGEPLLAKVRRDTLTRVYHWPQWNELRLRTSDRGVIRKSDPPDAGDELDLSLLLGIPLAPAATVDDTDSFRPVFVETVEAAMRSATTLLGHTAMQWFADRAAAPELAAVRAFLADETDCDLLIDAFDVVNGGDGTNVTLDLVRRIGDPETIGVKLVNHVLPRTGAPADRIEQRLPLPTGRVLPWHALAPTADVGRDELERDQMVAALLRRQLAEAVADTVEAELVDRIGMFYRQLTRTIDQIVKATPALNRVQLLLDAQQPPEAEAGTSQPQPQPAEESWIQNALREWSDRT